MGVESRAPGVHGRRVAGVGYVVGRDGRGRSLHTVVAVWWQLWVLLVMGRVWCRMSWWGAVVWSLWESGGVVLSMRQGAVGWLL